MCQECYPQLTWKQQQQQFAELATQRGNRAVKLTLELEVLVEIDPGKHPGESDWGDERDYCIPAHNEILAQLRGSPSHYWVEADSGNIEAIG